MGRRTPETNISHSRTRRLRQQHGRFFVDGNSGELLGTSRRKDPHVATIGAWRTLLPRKDTALGDPKVQEVLNQEREGYRRFDPVRVEIITKHEGETIVQGWNGTTPDLLGEFAKWAIHNTRPISGMTSAPDVIGLDSDDGPYGIILPFVGRLWSRLRTEREKGLIYIGEDDISGQIRQYDAYAVVAEAGDPRVACQVAAEVTQAIGAPVVRSAVLGGIESTPSPDECYMLNF